MEATMAIAICPIINDKIARNNKATITILTILKMKFSPLHPALKLISYPRKKKLPRKAHVPDSNNPPHKAWHAKKIVIPIIKQMADLISHRTTGRFFTQFTKELAKELDILPPCGTGPHFKINIRKG